MMFAALVSITAILGATIGVVASPPNFCNSDALLNITSYSYKNQSRQSCGCDTSQFCVQKCCALGFYVEKGQCKGYQNASVFQVPVYRNEQYLRDEDANSAVLVGVMDCDFFFPIIPAVDPIQDAFRLQEDGRLWTEVAGFLEQNSYCLDNVMDQGLSAMICYIQEDTDTTDAVFKHLYTLGMIISIPFLLLTFVAYALLPNKTPQMKSLMFYVANLMLGYLMLVIIYLASATLSSCGLIGYLSIFFFVASFFWMNVICIDTCYTICWPSHFHNDKNEKRRLIWYNCYAWGAPTIHVLLILGINQNSNEAAWYNPGVGKGQCFLKGGYPELLYFYGLIGILITIDVVLFVVTAIKLWILEKDAPRTAVRPKSEKNKRKFVLYLKLLFAMGLNWSLEIISWAISWRVGQVPSYIWYLTDICNALYGVFLFFIFVYKSSVWRTLRNEYNICVDKADPQHSLTVRYNLTEIDEDLK